MWTSLRHVPLPCGPVYTSAPASPFTMWTSLHQCPSITLYHVFKIYICGNQKVASSIPCRSVLEQDTEPLIAPDVQCAISVNVKMCIHPCKSLWLQARAQCLSVCVCVCVFACLYTGFGA